MRLIVCASKAFCNSDPGAFNYVTENALKSVNITPMNVVSSATEDTEVRACEIADSTSRTTILSAFSESLREYKSCLPDGAVNKYRPGVGVSMSEHGVSIDENGATLRGENPPSINILIGLSNPSID